jgi:predicted DNA-binding transcriptional regulator YafY
MKRLDRIHAILTALQARTIVRAEDLAEQFNVSVRTVYRDIRSLEESGIPLAAEAGVGYSLVKGFTIPPIHLTADEAEYLLLAERMLSATADTTTQQMVMAAMQKIRAVLRSSEKAAVEYLERRVLVSPPTHGTPIEPNVLTAILQSLRSSRQIRITYFSNSTQRTGERVIEPLGLAFYAQHWHVIAWCTSRFGYRDFRADRIQSVTVLDVSFIPSRHPLPSEILASQQFHDLPDPMDVIIDVHESVIPMFTDIRRSHGFHSEEAVTDGWQRMQFRPQYPDYFLCFLVSFGTAIRIIAPDQFRVRLINFAERIVAHHSSTQPEPS